MHKKQTFLGGKCVVICFAEEATLIKYAKHFTEYYLFILLVLLGYCLLIDTSYHTRMPHSPPDTHSPYASDVCITGMGHRPNRPLCNLHWHAANWCTFLGCLWTCQGQWGHQCFNRTGFLIFSLLVQPLKTGLPASPVIEVSCWTPSHPPSQPHPLHRAKQSHSRALPPPAPGPESQTRGHLTHTPSISLRNRFPIKCYFV